MKEIATVAATLVAITIVAAANAHVPSQCSEWIGGMKVLHAQIIDMIETKVRNDGPDLDDAHRAMDDSFATVNDQIGRTRRTVDEMLNDTVSLAAAFQKAALAYEDVAVDQEEAIGLHLKSLLMSASLIRCLESH